MDRIYNKLKRLKIEELKEECDQLGITHARCKTKDDYIRAFVKKKAKSAKLTPKKSARRVHSGKSDHSSVSGASAHSRCIIESMKDNDADKLNNYLKKRMKKRYVSRSFVKIFRLDGLKPGKRLRSDDQNTACKLVKLNEHKEPVRVRGSSKNVKRARTNNSMNKKRNLKNKGKSPKTVKRTRTARSSAKSSPYKIEKISEITNSVLEETPGNEIDQIIAEINEEEKDEIEDEILLSRSDVSRDSPISIPDDVSDRPLTRSMRKRYLAARNRGVGEPQRTRIEFEPEVVSAPSVDSEEHHRVYSPIRDRVMTPIKFLTRSIQRQVKRNHFINSEHFTNAFLLGIVFLSLMIWSVNELSRIPEANYEFSPTDNLPHMWKYNGKHFCTVGANKVHKLCAPNNDELYQHDLEEFEHIFDELIHSYNPCNNTIKHRIVKDIKVHRNFKEIVNNDYFAKRLTYSFDNNDSSKAHLILKNGFDAKAPVLNRIWWTCANWIEHSEWFNKNILFIALAILSVSAFSVYNLCIKRTEQTEAVRLVNLIHKDMVEKNIFRSGVDIHNIYDWYSSEVSLGKPEFTAKVLPFIQQHLNESPYFRSSRNRQGMQVWKLVS